MKDSQIKPIKWWPKQNIQIQCQPQSCSSLKFFDKYVDLVYCQLERNMLIIFSYLIFNLEHLNNLNFYLFSPSFLRVAAVNIWKSTEGTRCMGDFPNANDITEADQLEGGHAHRHSLLVGSLVSSRRRAPPHLRFGWTRNGPVLLGLKHRPSLPRVAASVGSVTLSPCRGLW